MSHKLNLLFSFLLAFVLTGFSVKAKNDPCSSRLTYCQASNPSRNRAYLPHTVLQSFGLETHWLFWESQSLLQGGRDWNSLKVQIWVTCPTIGWGLRSALWEPSDLKVWEGISISQRKLGILLTKAAESGYCSGGGNTARALFQLPLETQQNSMTSAWDSHFLAPLNSVYIPVCSGGYLRWSVMEAWKG